MRLVVWPGMMQRERCYKQAGWKPLRANRRIQVTSLVPGRFAADWGPASNSWDLTHYEQQHIKKWP